MSKKRKTRKQKEKANKRRNNQYKSIFDKISDSHNDDVDNISNKEQIIIGNESPTPGIINDNVLIKKDLLKTLYLVILFIILIAIMYIIDNNNNFLEIWSHNLINTLMK